MNLRDIDYILMAAEVGSFAKAAERCFVSQPSLSIQVKKAEDSLGQAIFVRHKNGVRLTAFGEKILPHLRKVQAEISAINDLSHKSGEVLRLGAIATVAPYIFTEIADLQNIIFEESVTSDLLQRLSSGEIDVALLALPIKESGLAHSLLYREPFYLASAKGNENLSSIDLDDLNSLPKNCRFVVLTEEHCLAQQVLHLCHLDKSSGTDSGADIFRASSLEMARRLVAGGKDVTLIPARAKRDDDGLEYRSLANRYYRDIALVYRKDSSNMRSIKQLHRNLKDRNLGEIL